MNELTLEWTQKAEGDFVTAIELLNLYIDTTADAICFHCQQCAEKYIKAYLNHQSIEFSDSENLLDLLLPCLHNDNAFLTVSSEIQKLNSYNIETLYPGQAANIKEAEGVVTAMEIVRAFVRSKLGLKSTAGNLE